MSGSNEQLTPGAVPWQKLISAANQINSTANFTGVATDGAELRENIVRFLTDVCTRTVPPGWEMWVFLFKSILLEGSIDADKQALRSLTTAVRDFIPQPRDRQKAINVWRKQVPEVLPPPKDVNVNSLPCKLVELCGFCSAVTSFSEEKQVPLDDAFRVFGKEVGHSHFARCASPFSGKAFKGTVKPRIAWKLSANPGPSQSMAKAKAQVKDVRDELEEAKAHLQEVKSTTVECIRSRQVPEPSYDPHSPEVFDRPMSPIAEEEDLPAADTFVCSPMDSHVQVSSTPEPTPSSSLGESSGPIRPSVFRLEPIIAHTKRTAEGLLKPPSTPMVDVVNVAMPPDEPKVPSHGFVIRRPREDSYIL